MNVERWQDYDCPLSGIDFDLNDDDMVFEGDRFHCSGCWQEHEATPALIQQYERELPDGELKVVPLQKRPKT